MVRTAYFNLFSVLMAVPTTVPTTVACEGAVAPGSKKCHPCRQVMFTGFRLAIFETFCTCIRKLRQTLPNKLICYFFDALPYQ